MKIKTNINGIEVEKEISIYQAINVLDKEDIVLMLLDSDTKLNWLQQQLETTYQYKLVNKYYDEMKQNLVQEIQDKIEDLKESIFYTNMKDYLDSEDKKLLDQWSAERKRWESILDEILCESVSSNH